MSDVDEIKERLDIVEVISGYVALQKAGRNFKALCPFHTEKTPSFTVNPERQNWHCFGACGTGGDAFSFVMRIESMEFGDALRLLAQKAGVTLGRRREGDKSEDLYPINREATRFYEEVLASPEGRRGTDYLDERGVDSDTRSAFQLGLSPSGGDRLKARLTALGSNLDQAVAAGLLRRADDGRVRDFFWGRLMFPIHDRRGRVVGFGARSMDGSDPKYINTSATPIFNKRATLYALHMSVGSIREHDTAVIVEGYMDAIAAHQHGYTNVVASMGTALTEQQVSQLRSVATKFVQALDPDAAGQEATVRSLESSWRVLEGRRLGRGVELDLKIAALPRGRDPDELIRQDPQEWDGLVQEAVPFMDFVIPAIASRYDLSSATGRAQAADALGPFIISIGKPIEQEHYFQKLADALGVSREALEASIGRPRGGSYQRATGRSGRDPARAASVSPLAGGRRDSLEEYVLALLLGRPELKDQVQSVEPEQFHESDNREVFTLWLSCTTIEELRDRLDETLHEHLDRLSQIDLATADRVSVEAGLDQCLRRLEQRHLKEIQEGLLASDDASLPAPRELEEAIVNVNTRLKELFSHQN